MSRVVFMCGPAGSGKSTYARGLEQQGMALLSLDVLRWQRETSSAGRRSDGGDVEEELRSALLELVAAGRDVVLDLSFWSPADA